MGTGSIPTPPPAPRPKSNNLPLYLSAAVAVAISTGLIVLLAVGRTTWAEVGPIITILAGVHSGASLAAFNGNQ